MAKSVKAGKSATSVDNLSKLRDLTDKLASTEIEHNTLAITEIKKVLSALTNKAITSESDLDFAKLNLVYNNH